MESTDAFKLIFACNDIHDKQQFESLQNLTLEEKIQASKVRISEWYNHWDGDVCIQYSQFDTFMVMNHLIKNLYPNITVCYKQCSHPYIDIVDNIKYWVKYKCNDYENKISTPIIFWNFKEIHQYLLTMGKI